MEATNRDLEWARTKLRWVLSQIAARLVLDAAHSRRVAREIRSGL